MPMDLPKFVEDFGDGILNADSRCRPGEPDVRPNSVVETTIVLQTTTGQSCRSCNSYTSKS